MAFEKGKNPNHPTAGDRIRVEPIRKKRDIKRIKTRLADRPRDLCLFTLGVNTAFRAGDLLNIRVANVKHLLPGDDLELKEEKTGRNRRVTLNRASIEAIRHLLDSQKYDDGDYLFLGQRGRLTVPTINNMVKGWCRSEFIKGNFGSHSLRKTWDYHQRISFNTPVPILMEAFGHATQKQTMQYLCIQPEEIRDVYMNEL